MSKIGMLKKEKEEPRARLGAPMFSNVLIVPTGMGREMDYIW